MPQKVYQLFFQRQYASFEIIRISHLVREILAHCKFREFRFRHKQQAKVNLEQIASKSPPIIFSTPICQFWNFSNISSGSRNIGTLRIKFKIAQMCMQILIK